MKNKRVPALLFLLVAGVACFGQIMMNGKRVAADWQHGLLLCPVAEVDYGVARRVLFTHDSTVVALTVDGVPCDGDSVALRSLAPGERLDVLAQMADGSTRTAGLQFTTLPIVAFDGTTINKTTYVIVPFTVMLPDADDLVARAKVRYRGSLINNETVVKRAFHVKFVDDNDEKMDVKLFGLRNDNNWILDGGAADLLRIRNRVATDLWLDMATKPYYSADEPNARSGVRGQMVEAFVSGDYRGIYNMSEALDRKQMKLTKYDTTTLEIHGQLWKAGDRSRVTLFDSVPPVKPTGRTERYNYFETKYPEFDEVSPTNYDALYNLGLLSWRASDANFAAQIGDLLDVPVIIDYYIFLETLLAFDNQGKNIYWGCHDRTVNPKLTLGVWDLDTSFGNDWRNTSPHSVRVQPWHGVFADFVNHHRFLLRLKELDVDNFNARVLERYAELREGVLDTDALIDRFTQAVERLNQCGAAQREAQRFNPDPWLRQPIDLNSELQYVTQWIKLHMDYLDDFVFTTEHYRYGDVNKDNRVDVLDINTLLNMMLYNKMATARGDVNHDQVIDVDDLNIVVNIILELGNPVDPGTPLDTRCQ
ncbi:MAG: CotH kinase family protein [Muribaculaceae bacterium]|nr:CotH kinase family protein [Muribaculaceae bacterium]